MADIFFLFLNLIININDFFGYFYFILMFPLTLYFRKNTTAFILMKTETDHLPIFVILIRFIQDL